MTRISQLFQRVRRERRPALIAYLTAGDPNSERTVSLVHALERGGADLIELGVPFSDPIADGPVIQRAAERALRAGTSLKRVLSIATEIRNDSNIPLLLFTYMNPVVRYGVEALARDAKTAGIDGCLLTDLSVEEGARYTETMQAEGLDTVFLAAPTSTERRLDLIARYSTGFIYLVSRTGVTGERSSFSNMAGDLVRRMRAATDKPLAIGFGISTPAHVAEAGALADGVIVGSAIVRLIEDHGSSPDLEARLEAFTRELASGLNAKAQPGAPR